MFQIPPHEGVSESYKIGAVKGVSNNDFDEASLRLLKGDSDKDFLRVLCGNF